MSGLNKELLIEIVDYNKEVLKKFNNDTKKAIDEMFTINYKEYSIWNFFMDETMRFKVVPEQKYGEDKLKEIINEYKKIGDEKH